jgi:hypothetical protein
VTANSGSLKEGSDPGNSGSSKAASASRKGTCRLCFRKRDDKKEIFE